MTYRGETGKRTDNKNRNQNPRIASAKGRVKPLARLLRCATAAGDSAPRLRLKRLIWPKGSFQRIARPEIPLFPREQRVSPDQPAAVQGAKRRSEPLTARTDLQSSATRERGFKSEGEGPVEEAPGGACADARGDTLLVELRALLHIHPHPQNSKRLHLRFHLGRADHTERVK